MANRPRGFGLTAEVKGKIAAKYDVEKEQECRVWMESVTGEALPGSASPAEPLGAQKFHEALKDGTYLCKLMSAITGKPVKHNDSKMAFKQMENITKFLTACENYGMHKADLFQTVDLYENQNMWQVVCTIMALGRKAQANGYAGPVLGPREATANKRDFSQEQLAAGQNVIGLQMGTNKLASQKGMSFGNSRHIADIKCDDASKEGQSVIGLQMGTNEGASQAGMTFGKSRGIMGTDK